MKIGIIGTGNIGSIIAKKLSNAGHEIKVTNTRDMDELQQIAEKLGATAATLQDVVKNVDVIMFSMPFGAYQHLPKDLLQDVPEDVVVMDTSNYYPVRDGELPGLDGKTESEYIAKILVRPVTKVFNNILEHTLKHKGKPSSADGRIAISVAGDNDNHKKMAATLVDTIGFDAVDAGSLAESWRQQPGTPAYCTELNITELKQALVDGDRDKAPAARDMVMQKLQELKADPTHEEIVAINRSTYAV